MDRARTEAKQLAIANEKTYVIYKEGKALSYTDAATARTKGIEPLEYVSKEA
jgi:hypothetical protein